MTTISAFMIDQHHHCDDMFAAAENAVAGGKWAEAGDDFNRFQREMTHHFDIEERLLFPAFEAASGMTDGPTQVMRTEHTQVRDVLADMAQAVTGKDSKGYLGHSETLLMLMQQHNLKEEQILYRMIDQTLSGQKDALLNEMRELAANA